MSFYSRYILAPLISCGCGCQAISDQRAHVVPKARGTVLELGAGAGHNLHFYDPQAVTEVIAVEPEPALAERFARAARQAPVKTTLIEDIAENLALPPNSIDTILTTFVLCTIPDGIAALQAAKRALKPDGLLLFCEHGLAPDESVARTQQRLEPLWRRIFGGCHLSRPIPDLIRNAGFQIETMQSDYMPKSPRFASYLYEGSARAVA